MKITMSVTRTVQQCLEIVIEANSVHEARQIAIDKAGDMDFSGLEKDVEYNAELRGPDSSLEMGCVDYGVELCSECGCETLYTEFAPLNCEHCGISQLPCDLCYSRNECSRDFWCDWSKEEGCQYFKNEIKPASPLLALDKARDIDFPDLDNEVEYEDEYVFPSVEVCHECSNETEYTEFSTLMCAHCGISLVPCTLCHLKNECNQDFCCDWSKEKGCQHFSNESLRVFPSPENLERKC